MKRTLWFVLFCFLPFQARAANEQYAVIRIPSHGASATVIETGPGYTWILGCGHAYQGAARQKRMTFDIAAWQVAQAKPAQSELVRVDYQMDLSLVLLHDGPVAFKCPVAPLGWRDWQHTLWSVGFDEMKLPPQMRPTHIVQEQGGDYFTSERPWHGRSGGGLIDMTSGTLVGVVQGYETSGPRQGMYVSLATIHRFLGATGNAALPQWQPQQQFRLPSLQQPFCPPSR